MPLTVSFSISSGINISLMVGAEIAVADIVSSLSADMKKLHLESISLLPFLLLYSVLYYQPLHI